MNIADLDYYDKIHRKLIFLLRQPVFGLVGYFMPAAKNKIFYGWVVLFSLLIIGIVILGVRFSFGVFFKDIESAFNLSRAETSAVLSLNIVIGGVFAFLLGYALDRYGPRVVFLFMGTFTGLSMLLTSHTNSFWQLFLTYSLLLAAGSGAIFTAINSILSRWFDKKRGLVLGIGGSCAGLGQMVMAPFATFLISSFDWRMAFIVMGGIAWIIVLPLSRLLKKDPHEIGALSDGVKPDSGNMHIKKPETKEVNIQMVDYSLLFVLRTKSFWLLLCTLFFYGYNMFLILTHLVPHATDIGFSAIEAATALSLVGLAAAVGRVLMGLLSDRVGRKLTAIVCAVLQAGATVGLIWSQELWMLYMFALVWGFGYGGFMPGTAAIISDTFTLVRIGSIYGILDIGFSVGGALGSVAGGFIFDFSGSYFIAFLIAALVMFLAILLIASVSKEKAQATF
jgi:MFS family permease